MSKAKTKKKVYKDVTTEAAQAASQSYAEAQNRLSALQAEMNEKLNEIKADYADEITELTDELTEPEAILQAYATEQKENWGKKKSVELLHTTIGFKTNPPKVSKDKKFTWDAVTELLTKNKLFKPFIRTKDEINKEAILALKDEKLLATLKDEAYVFVDQDETFYITPKVEEIIPA